MYYYAESSVSKWDRPKWMNAEEKTSSTRAHSNSIKHRLGIVFALGIRLIYMHQVNVCHWTRTEQSWCGLVRVRRRRCWQRWWLRDFPSTLFFSFIHLHTSYYIWMTVAKYNKKKKMLKRKIAVYFSHYAAVAAAPTERQRTMTWIVPRIFSYIFFFIHFNMHKHAHCTLPIAQVVATNMCARACSRPQNKVAVDFTASALLAYHTRSTTKKKSVSTLNEFAVYTSLSLVPLLRGTSKSGSSSTHPAGTAATDSKIYVIHPEW